MEIDSAGVEHFLKQLAEAPRRISGATRGISETRLTQRTQDEPWPVGDILAHLRASADVREKYIRAMLVQDNPTMRYISPRTYIRKTDYLELSFAESFQAYQKQRMALLKTLQNLSIQDWSRSATIKEWKETIFSYTMYLTQHEIIHCQQIEELLK